MKIFLRILSAILCAGLIISMPFFLTSPELSGNLKMELMEGEMSEEEDEGDEIDFGRLLFSSASAEELIVETWDEGELHIEPEWALPLDFSVPPAPNQDCYTEDGYEDQSIRVKVETLDLNGVTVHTARVQIADASQLRTAVAYDSLKNDRTMNLQPLARDNNAVIAMNGDLFCQLPEKKRFEYRMTQKIRSKTSNVKDTLIIDDKGDFHLFVRSKGLSDFADELKKNGGKVVNAFMFGPALVRDGELLSQDKEYDYARKYKNPRSAIGQTGPLSYILVIVEGRGENGGVTHEELGQIMFDLGCIQAYNLDGGNTAEMIMFQESAPDGIKFHFKGDQTAGVRPQKDIIYFATAVPEK